ncbi:ATP-binding protein [Pelovirga terrestris]|uniref:histidine kinase n=1 Tax=Pelovirga terrestris TaxID=2771352 RepID=A0A8J6QZM6_9BACT|nr:ATP-binding protein [Pelovirga terrestris]MBD1401472.1 PAS domain S-box protein [Pelovirga terrestris]
MKLSLWPESIKARVTLSTLGVFLLSLWLLAFLTTRMLERDISRLVADAQSSAARQMALQIDRELQSRLEVLEHKALLIDSDLMAHPVALQNVLQHQPIPNSLFNVSVLVVNNDGIAIADTSNLPERIGINYRERVDAFAIALNEGHANVGNPLMGLSTGQPLIPLAVPIRDASGKVIGALGGAIDLSRPNFFDDLTARGYGGTGHYSIISKNGRIIVTSSNSALIMTALPAPGVNPVLDRAMLEDVGNTYRYTTVEGIDTLAVTRGTATTDWLVAVMTPVSEAFAPIDDMLRRMTLITLAVTLLVGIALWWVMQHQLQPMLTTVDTLGAKVRSAQPMQSLPMTGRKEVDSLIAAFNRLLGQLSAREEETQRFKTIADNAVYGEAIADLEGTLVYINRFLAEIHGYHPAELIGKNLSVFHATSQLEQLNNTLNQLSQNGYFSPCEVWHADRHGSEFPMLMSGVLIKDDQGCPQYMATSAVDITDRKAAEVALKQINDELEQFVYIVSHDLKSPLITINTFLGILQEDITDSNTEGITEDLDFIKQAAAKIEALLDALLRLSRIGRIDSAPQTQPVKKMVDECLKVLGGRLQQQQVEVVVGEMTDQWHGDLTHFGQLWQNLIENAIKYMGDQPRPRIEIGTEQRTEGQVFYVRDNGIGIAPAHHQRIFTMFAQLDQKSEGTGLGLALVKKIVESYQGRIWVESAGKGQGSCFWFTLPAAVDAPWVQDAEQGEG